MIRQEGSNVGTRPGRQAGVSLALAEALSMAVRDVSGDLASELLCDHHPVFVLQAARARCLSLGVSSQPVTRGARLLARAAAQGTVDRDT